MPTCVQCVICQPGGVTRNRVGHTRTLIKVISHEHSYAVPRREPGPSPAPADSLRQLQRRTFIKLRQTFECSSVVS